MKKQADLTLTLMLIASAVIFLKTEVVLAAEEIEMLQRPRVNTANVRLEVTKLGDSLYLFQGSRDAAAMAGDANGKFNGAEFTGANTGLYIGNDGVVVVDPKYASVKKLLFETMKNLGARSETPQFVISTHIHMDHLEGNAAFDHRATRIAHQGLRNAIEAGRVDFSFPKESWPTLTYDRSLTLHLDGRDINVVNYPDGHTDGDSVVYFPYNVVQMGDLFFNNLLPKVDLKNAGNFYRYRAIVRSIYDQLPDDAKIIPGHGPLATKQDLRTYIELLDETGDMVLSKIKQGKTLADIQKEGLPEKWRSWAWSLNSPEHYLELLYQSAQQATPSAAR